MTSVERVRRAIRGQPIDRLPVSFELIGETDLKELYFRAPRDWEPQRYPPFVFDIDNYEPVTYARKEDEWGVVWEYGGTVTAAGIDVEHPLQDLAALDQYRFPDPLAEGRFDGFDEAIDRYSDKYLWASNLHLLFERLYFLHGFNETLMDLILRPADMEYILDRILAFQLGLVRALGECYRGRIQAFSSTDDLGNNSGMLISPELWRSMFKHRYARIAEEVHRQGFDFWLHSDGKIEEIVPDLIEVGVDVFNLCDPQLLGIEEFGSRFAGKSCFTLYLDVQKTAESSDRAEVEREAAELVRYWSNGDGSGVLAMDYRDMGSAAELAMERKGWALNAFKGAFREKITGREVIAKDR